MGLAKSSRPTRIYHHQEYDEEDALDVYGNSAELFHVRIGNVPLGNVSPRDRSPAIQPHLIQLRLDRFRVNHLVSHRGHAIAASASLVPTFILDLSIALYVEPHCSWHPPS